MLAGNLSITNVHLVDASDRPIGAPVIGEMTYAEADWNATGLSAADQYVVRFFMDGVALDSRPISGSLGDGPFYWYLGGWYASPGLHSLTAKVDGAGSVAETDEADNSATISFVAASPVTLPQKLAWPLGGVPFHDWSVVNYLDVNPLSDQVADFRGGPFAYDGHNGYDLSLPNFTRMDAGLPVFAAASGTVTLVEDGHFDRQTSFNPDPANHITIDLGNGWTTEYYHLLSHSIAVKVGDVVRAGQLLGLVGSSGNSTGAHLHFALRHNGDLVETFYQPRSYWADPLPYQGDVAPTLTDLGVTNSSVFNDADINERPDPVTVFPTSADWSVRYWYRLSHLRPTDSLRVNWYRPDGSLATFYTYAPSSYERFSLHGWNLSPSVWATSLGTWQVATVVDGAEIGRASFRVTGAAGPSRIRVTQDSTYIINGRSTPIDLGTTSEGGGTPRLTFQIRNIGSSTMTTAGLTLPDGFELATPLPTSIAPGSSQSFTLQLDSNAVGSKFGEVRFATNDPANPVFRFNVSGTVGGTPPAGSPALTLPGPALAVTLGTFVRRIDPGATLADPDSANFNGGHLRVEMASGGTVDDRLSIADGGPNAGRIGLVGSRVTFGGVTIGRASITNGLAALLDVALNANATLAAVRALARAVTYANLSTSPTTAPRYVRFSVVDGTGLASGAAVKEIVNSGRRASTTTALASSLPASVSGQSVTFRSVVTTDEAGVGVPAGSVTFRDGDTILATVPINTASGTARAAFVTSTLAVGTHTITATYGGDPSDRPGVSEAVRLVVSRASTSTTLTAAPAAPVRGQSVTLRAVVAVLAPGAGSPAGSVTFRDGATVLGTALLRTVGGITSARLITTRLAVGTHRITATYNGDANHRPSTSATWRLAVSRASTSTRLTASPSAPSAGQVVTLRAVVAVLAPGAGTPTGLITFTDGGTVVGTARLRTVGGVTSASLATSSLAVGRHRIVATYGGDANGRPSTSATLILVVSRATSRGIPSSPSASAAGVATRSVAFLSDPNLEGEALAEGPDSLVGSAPIVEEGGPSIPGGSPTPQNSETYKSLLVVSRGITPKAPSVGWASPRRRVSGRDVTIAGERVGDSAWSG